MVARVFKRLAQSLRRLRPASSKKAELPNNSGSRPNPTRAKAALSLGVVVAAFSFAGCPCISGPVNASPALRWFLFSNFGASRMCPEMLKRGMPIRSADRAPTTGRFFPMQCNYVVNDATQTVTLQFAGTGYVFMNPMKRVGFSATGSVEYRPDFQIADDDIYVWGRLNRTVQGPSFQLGYVENGLIDLATNLPGLGTMANFLGSQVVSSEMTRGFTVVHNEDKGDLFALGLISPPQKPFRPFDVSQTERYTFANETTDVHQNQRDFLGPFEIVEGGQALFLTLQNQGPAVDIMIVDKNVGDAWRDGYQRGLPAAMGPPPGPVLAGGPLSANASEQRRYPLAPGLYYVVVDNTATAGLVSPPFGLLNPLGVGDAISRLSYVAQLGE